MKVWTCVGFTGYWPVGTAAVVVAKDREQAKALLEVALRGKGLEQEIPLEDIRELDVSTVGCWILLDGNY
jgi:hypothetical protein